jgi:hypothetical protein
METDESRILEEITRLHFGYCAAKVINVLVLYGASSIDILLEHTSLNFMDLRNSLLILVKNHIVEESSKTYTVDRKEIMN